MQPSVHVAVQVAAPAAAVSAFVTGPTNLPRWAAGLTGARWCGGGRTRIACAA